MNIGTVFRRAFFNSVSNINSKFYSNSNINFLLFHIWDFFNLLKWNWRTDEAIAFPTLTKDFSNANLEAQEIFNEVEQIRFQNNMNENEMSEIMDENGQDAYESDENSIYLSKPMESFNINLGK